MRQKSIRTIKKILKSYHLLPEHKKYLEFFTALLSIPVLLTVIILNFNTLSNLKGAKPTEAPTEKVFINVPVTGTSLQGNEHAASPTPQGPCKKGIAPIGIDSPQENETITDNPVSIDISYEQGNYCSAVWAYRINGGKWSDYDNKSVSLYNLPQGKIKFELKVKSLVTTDEKSLSRNFVYKNDTTVTPTIIQDQLGTSSAPLNE